MTSIYLGAIGPQSSQTLTITETQLTSDGTALSLINADNGSYNVAVTNVLAADASGIAAEVGAYSHATLISISVTDTAAHVQASLDSLETLALGGTLTSITLTDSGTPTITVSELTYESDIFALDDITGSFNIAITQALAADAVGLSQQPHVSSVSIVDSAANVQLELNYLEGIAAKLGTIVLNDVSAPTMTLSASAVESDATVLAKISAAAGSYTLDVTGAKVTDVTAIEGQTFQGATLSFGISDSAADVQADLLLGGSSVLKAYLASISSISLNDSSTPTMSLLASTVEYDASVFAKIAAAAGSYTLDVTNALISDITTIEGQSFNNATLSFAVSDSAADVQADLRLGGSSVLKSYNANISTISLSDATAPTLALFASTVESDASVFAKIAATAGSYTLDVNNAAITDVTAIEGQTFQNATLSFAVVDSAADVQSDLSLGAGGVLEGYIASIRSITLTGNGTHTITLAETAYNADGAALAKIVNSYSLSITNALAADAASIALNNHVTSISVYDTGAHIASALDALNSNGDVTAIIISDNAPLNLAAHSAATDSRALGLLHNQNGNPVSLTITDTAANITTYLDVLNGISTISAITISNNSPLTLLASQVANDATVLAKVGNANGQPIIINVTDLAANISTYLNQLEANNFIGTVTVSDNLSVVASTAQLTGDSDVLAALVNANGSAATVTVLDTAANISADLGSLNTDTQVTSLVISNNTQLNLNVSQVVNDTRALSELRNANGSTVTEKVSDTAVNIQTYLNNLQADSLITSIVVSNNVSLTLTAAEVVNDGTALSEVSNKNGGTVTFTVSDTAANISTYLNQLTASSQFSRISSITVSDNNSVTLSVAQMTSDAAALAKLVNQNGSPYTLTVRDTGADLSGAAFDSLNGNSHVTSIVISDNLSITLSVAELTGDTRALGELTNASGPGYSLIITDTASNIAGDFSGLNGNSHVHKIIVSNSGSGGTITLTAAQAIGNTTALGELFQANGTSQFLVNISDSSVNLTGSLNALESIVSDLGSITIADYNNLSVSVALVLADSAVLAKMHYLNGSAYALSLSDTAAAINANIATLAANTHIQSVTVTDSGVITATYAIYSQYNSFFYDIQGTHYLDIINVTGQSYTSVTETINGSHQLLLQDFYDAGGNLLDQLAYSYHQDGTETITGTSIAGKPYTSYVQNLDTLHRVSTATYYNADGSVYDSQSFTYNADGTTSESITGLQGITLETLLIDSHGNTENEFVYNNTNTITAYFYENGQTFTSTGETTTVKITSGTSGDIFNFNGQFGSVGISNYVPGSETINFDHHDFANIAAVEAHIFAYGTTGIQIKLDATDFIIFQGITVAQFEAYTSDWHFI